MFSCVFTNLHFCNKYKAFTLLYCKILSLINIIKFFLNVQMFQFWEYRGKKDLENLYFVLLLCSISIYFFARLTEKRKEKKSDSLVIP